MEARQWIDRARVHFRSADALAEQKLYTTALFMAHQAVELALKAVLVAKTGKLPPRIHMLKRLAEVVGYPRAMTLAEVDPAYVGTRYPEGNEPALTAQEVRRDVKLAQEVLESCEPHVM